MWTALAVGTFLGAAAGLAAAGSGGSPWITDDIDGHCMKQLGSKVRTIHNWEVGVDPDANGNGIVCLYTSSYPGPRR